MTTAYEEALHCITREAGADLSASQYCGVKQNSSQQVVLPSAQVGEPMLGVLQNKPDAAGRAATVAIGGVTKLLLGGTVAAGERFTFDTDGKAIAVGSGDDFSFGQITEGGTSGTIGSGLIQPTGSVI